MLEVLSQVFVTYYRNLCTSIEQDRRQLVISQNFDEALFTNQSGNFMFLFCGQVVDANLFPNFILFETVSYQNFSPNTSDYPSSIFVNFGSVSY